MASKARLLIRRALLVAPLGVVLHTAPAAAQEDKAAASVLFREARDLLKKGEIEAACDKFQASVQAAPLVGAKLSLADCLARLGKTASAWSEFEEVAVLARNARDREREREARKRADELRPKLSTLVITVSPDAQVPGLEVKRGTATISPGSYGTPLPVDPGDLEISARAPGYETWTSTVTVPPGPGATALEVPALTKLPPPPTPPVDDPLYAQDPSTPNRSIIIQQVEASGSGRRTAAIVIGSVGVVALIAGGVFALQASSAWNDAEPDCPDGVCQTADAKSKADDAKSFSTIATLGGVIGGVAVVTAGALFFWPSGKSRRESARIRLMPVIGNDGAGFVVRGGF